MTTKMQEERNGVHEASQGGGDQHDAAAEQPESGADQRVDADPGIDAEEVAGRLAVSGTFSARTQSEAGNAVGERVLGHGKSLCRLRTRLQFGKNGTNSSALD